mmetsp:Transcript_10610/g.16193  ORF Transcript_10610/g.16193 Transcript_10610/m.16193 type:complete len:341 (+) Transcript_10610:116-1138(+)
MLSSPEPDHNASSLARLEQFIEQIPADCLTENKLSATNKKNISDAICKDILNPCKHDWAAVAANASLATTFKGISFENPNCLKGHDKLAKNFIEFTKQAEVSTERSFVGISYRVKEKELSHQFDVDNFASSVEHVFSKFYKDDDAGEYIAPYFVFVQSSGMGKTKILYSYKNAVCDGQSKGEAQSALLVLCRRKNPDRDRAAEEEAIFDHFIDFASIVQTNDDFQKASERVYPKLDELVQGKSGKVVLMFDEAHYLLKKHEYKYEEKKKSMDAFLFRIIRLWLCLIRVNLKVVAIFSGTNAKLKNFALRDDVSEQLTDSRNTRNQGHYKKRGKVRSTRFS